MLNEGLSQMRKPFVVLYRIADVTDGLTAASSAGQSGVDLRSSSFAPRQSPSELVTALGLASVERNVSLTASSLLTLDNARMRFGIVLAQSQPSVKVVQITDRDRARNREAVRDKEERLVVRTV